MDTRWAVLGLVALGVMLVASPAAADVAVEGEVRCKAEDKDKPCSGHPGTICRGMKTTIGPNHVERTFYSCEFDAAQLNKDEEASRKEKKRFLSCTAAVGASNSEAAAQSPLWALLALPLILRRLRSPKSPPAAALRL